MVVFDNKRTSENDYRASAANKSDEDESSTAFLIRILQYLETPQYLRKALFPMHSSLRFVVCINRLQYVEAFVLLTVCFSKLELFVSCVLQGLLPPLDAPHHLRKHEWAPYREGILP